MRHVRYRLFLRKQGQKDSRRIAKWTSGPELLSTRISPAVTLVRVRSSSCLDSDQSQ